MDLRIEAEILLIAEKRGYTIINKRYRSSTGFKIVPRKEVSQPEKEWIKKANKRLFDIRVAEHELSYPSR